MKKKKSIKFTLGGEKWDIPLPIFILLLLITLVLMLAGAWMGFQFGSGQL
ncbi:hypothetical protein [Algoriphagus namhaensis]